VCGVRQALLAAAPFGVGTTEFVITGLMPRDILRAPSRPK
jgi:predicted MFS family arabinose efflux permease